MQVYDLDKTQEWLNRTLAIGKESPIRGGLKPDRWARRATGISLCATILIMAVGVWVGVLLRGVAPVPVLKHAEPDPPAGRQSSGGVAAAAATRDAYAPATFRRTITTRPVDYRPPPDALDLSTPNLDGDLHPLPGHAAPPAPVFLDGPSGTGLFR